MYVYGDGTCTTTTGPGTPDYFGGRLSNGLVWVEDLASLQGLTFDDTRNNSKFGNYSTWLVSAVSNFPTAGASTALVVVWVADADIYDNCLYDVTNLTLWTNDINQSQTNHAKAIQTLYNKGVRTLVMPNAIDMSKVPQIAQGMPSSYLAFYSQQCAVFNTAFSNTLNTARSTHSGLTIYSPDFFTLHNNLTSHPADYGVVNAKTNGQPIDALDDYYLTDKSFTGPGASYIFWDDLDPTAKVHLIMGTIAHQLISPVQPTITKFTFQGASNKLDVVNIPMARDGVVQGSTTLTNWSTVKNILNSTNASQSIFVPASASPQQVYRLRF
jgi:thermolabile hemolysin